MDSSSTYSESSSEDLLDNSGDTPPPEPRKASFRHLPTEIQRNIVQLAVGSSWGVHRAFYIPDTPPGTPALNLPFSSYRAFYNFIQDSLDIDPRTTPFGTLSDQPVALMDSPIDNVTAMLLLHDYYSVRREDDSNYADFNWGDSAFNSYEETYSMGTGSFMLWYMCARGFGSYREICPCLAVGSTSHAVRTASALSRVNYTFFNLVFDAIRQHRKHLISLQVELMLNDYPGMTEPGRLDIFGLLEHEDAEFEQLLMGLDQLNPNNRFQCFGSDYDDCSERRLRRLRHTHRCRCQFCRNFQINEFPRKLLESWHVGFECDITYEDSGPKGNCAGYLNRFALL